jgi:hypothetical protein
MANEILPGPGVVRENGKSVKLITSSPVKEYRAAFVLAGPVEKR